MTSTLKITKARAFYFQSVCDLAEAYMDERYIEDKGTIRAIKDIRDAVDLALGKNH